MENLPVVDSMSPFSYANGEVPPTYKCSKCGKTHVKLWREYCVIPSSTELLCAECLSQKFKKPGFTPVFRKNRRGLYCWTVEKGSIYDETDQIEDYVPAVPTEENDTFWGYTTVPKEGVEWWYNLKDK